LVVACLVALYSKAAASVNNPLTPNRAMRTAVCLIVLTALAGCENAAPVAPQTTPPAAPIGFVADAPAGEAASSAEEPLVPAPEDVPPDLGTRPAGEDWPAFLGPRGDSTSIEKGILTHWKEKPPRIVWQRPLGVGYGMPTVSRGRLFQFCRYGGQARLTCHKSETGEELWRFDYPTRYEDLYGYNNGPRCSPVVDGGLVYLFGAEGMLHCMRVEDGKPVWKVDTARQFEVIQNFFGVGSTPVIYENLLIVQIGGSPPESREAPPGQLNLVQPNGTGVVAFDKRTGEVKYKLADELASYSGPTLAKINGRDWCFVFARGGLLGFDPATGKQEFHYPWRADILESVNASNPVVVDDLVFISECYGPGSSLLKVRPGGYDVVWADSERKRQKAMQTHWNTAIHRDGYLYGSSGRHTNNAELRCIELKTGEVKWSEPELSRSSLLYVDDHLICLTEYGDLLLLRTNPEKFDLVGQLELVDQTAGPLPPGTQPRKLLNHPAWAAPILSHGLLYVRGDDRLACLELIPQSKD
jgi:outer membrane protein assembly factor BamB